MKTLIRLLSLTIIIGLVSSLTSAQMGSSELAPISSVDRAILIRHLRYKAQIAEMFRDYFWIRGPVELASFDAYITATKEAADLLETFDTEGIPYPGNP